MPSPENVAAEAEQSQQEDAPDFGCLREVSVEIPADVVSRELDATVQRYAKVARIPGFRKGKAPASMVRNRFPEEIRGDVLENLVPQYFREVVQKEGFRPISQPQVRDLHMEAGSPVRFRAVFEILPEIQLGNYKEIRVDTPEVKVTDEDVETELKRLQERQSSYDPVNEDRPLRDGDFAQISFQAIPKADAAPAEGNAESEAGQSDQPSQPKQRSSEPVKMDEVLVEIGGPNTVPEFSQNLRDAKPGDERSFDVTYPADYQDQRLAGQTFTYTTKVNAIKKKTAPELTDEFAKELSADFQTLDDLKKRLHDGILAERQRQVVEEARDMLLKQLTDSHNFPVPEALVQRQIDSRLEHFLRTLAAQGMQTEQMKRLDFPRLRASQRAMATKEVKANLLLDKIAEVEGIEATDEDVQREIQLLALQTRQAPEALRERLAKEGATDRIRGRLRADKALQFLYNQSTGNAGNGTVEK
jgi:trigger factor